MLFGEQFGRRHQSHLFAVGDGAQRCQCGNQRFTGTDVALHQTHHRYIQRHIVFNFGRYARLCAGRLKRQIGQKLIFQLAIRTERLSVKTLRTRA